MTDSDASGGLGDNSLAAGQLTAYVSRIENLEGEIKALNDDKGEVYAEAKACGLCKKTLRKLIARRRKDGDEVREEDMLLELYESAIAGVLAAEAKDPLD